MLSTHYNEMDSDNISIGSSGALKSGISPWLPRKQARRLFLGALLNSFWFTAPTSHAASAGIASFAVEYVQPGRHHADMVGTTETIVRPMYSRTMSAEAHAGRGKHVLRIPHTYTSTAAGKGVV